MSGFIRSTNGFSSNEGFSSNNFQSNHSYQSNCDIIKTGIPSLDSFIKIIPGTITAFYEDENSYLHNTFLQVFISEAKYRNNRKLHVLSAESKNLFYFDVQKEDSVETTDTKLIIAWRYKNLSTGNDKFNFNLSKKVLLETQDIIKNLETFLRILKESKECSFVIFSLFSPLFFTQQNTINNLKDNSDILKFLYEIRKYTKINRHTVYLSIPVFLNEFDPSLYFDNIIYVVSILALPSEKAHYSCILELKKFLRLGTIDIESYKYGVKVSSKKVLVERIDIPPEDNFGAQPDSTAACGHGF